MTLFYLLQQTESSVDRVRLQFGQFGVGGDYNSSFSNLAPAPQHSEPQSTSFQQQATNFASTSYGSQPANHTGVWSDMQLCSLRHVHALQP